MANISIRKGNGNRPIATPDIDWEPARLMRSLLNWDPFREMAPFIPEERAIAFNPAFEVKETKDAYVFKADVPGMKEQDLEITMTGNRLTVSGKRESEKQEQGDQFYTYERTYGSFSRSFTLPDGANVEDVHADLREGVLTLNVAKKPEVQPKKVEIQSPPTTKA